MVPEEAHECETIELSERIRRRLAQLVRCRRLMFGAAVLFVGIITFLVIFVVNLPNLQNDEEAVDDITAETEVAEVADDDVEADEDEENVAVEPARVQTIDFQPVIDEWVESVAGSKGVMIYDLDLDIVAGKYNADEKFATASLYKLFVVYEGYRRVQNGEWSTDELECLDLAIRESNSACAEAMWAKIGRGTLDTIVQNDFGLTRVSVGSLRATPREIMQMMKIFYEHEEITDEALTSRMMDSFLNQPVTAYNWRQGLPSGFSDAVKVYNKVGWQYMIDEEDEEGNVVKGHWEVYDDAAIIEFTENERHFIVVVMTSNVDFRQIRRFGTMIEEHYQ